MDVSMTDRPRRHQGGVLMAGSHAVHPRTLPHDGPSTLQGEPFRSERITTGFSLSRAGQQLKPVPNGGLLAWLQVLGSFFLFFNSWGIINSFGVFQTYYNSSEGILPLETDSRLSWVGCIQAFLMLVIGVVTGPLYDAGYFRGLVMTGSFLVIFGMIMTSRASEYWHVMLSQGICVGIGSGCLFIPSVAILPQYFTTKRVLAVGIAASGSSIAGVTIPIVFAKLQPEIGFPHAMLVVSYLTFATLIVPVAVMRVRELPNTARSFVDLTALKEVPFVLFTGAVFFLLIGLYIPYFYMAGFAAHLGLSRAFSFYTLAMLNGASTFGRILPNYMADRTGPLNILAPATIISALIIFAWITAHNHAGIILVSLFYGFFSGALVSLLPSTVVQLSPNMGIVGTRLGTSFFIASPGLLVGNPVAGAILSQGRDRTYLGEQLFCACCLLIAGLLLLAARISKVGFALRAKT